MTYVSTVIADGAVGLWTLGDASVINTAAAVDAKGNQNGVYSVSAAGLTGGQTGIVGGGGTTAVLFGGATGNYVSIANGASQQVTDTFTIEVWLKVLTGAVGDMFDSQTTSSMQFGFTSANPPTIYCAKKGGATIMSSTATIPVDSSFHHIVWTKSGSTNKLYLDGADITPSVSNLTLSTSTGGYNIGRNPANNNYVHGTMGMVALYATAISAATVSNHYAMGIVAAPTNSVAPAVTGTATVGQTLTTTDGTWTGSPSFTYQWQRDTAGNLSFSNIGSATASTYVLVDADDGNKVRCVVTGTNASGNASANSNALGLVVEPVPTNSVAPTVSGSTAIGSTLTATTGTWANMGGSVATYAYQWTRDGSNIAAATSSTYVTVTADGGHAVGCKVTATNSGGAGTATASSNTITVAAAATGTLNLRLDDTSRVDSGIRLTLGTGN